MGQAPEHIERHIHETRARLEENLAELRTRVRANLDWRTQMRRHPAAFATAAFTGGLILALFVGRRVGATRLKRLLRSGVGVRLHGGDRPARKER